MKQNDIIQKYLTTEKRLSTQETNILGTEGSVIHPEFLTFDMDQCGLDFQ